MRATTVLVALAGALTAAAPVPAARPLLDDHLLVTWYGNPRSRAMGVLGEAQGAARAEALRRQAARS